MFESKSLENFWKQIAGKYLKAFWKQIAGKCLKAKRWQNFESFLNARPYCFCNGCGTPRTNSSAFAREKDARQKKCYFADPLPVYLLITVKTNARVNTRGSQMLPTNRAMRWDSRRRSHTMYTVWRMKEAVTSHYWRGTLKFTYCETVFNLKTSDSYNVARLPEHCFTEYTKTRVIYKM